MALVSQSQAFRVKNTDMQEGARATKKQRLEWQSTPCRSYAYEPDAHYFLLEKEDLDWSGLPPVRSMLYCRPMFHQQVEFLRYEVLEKGHCGWILGPSGTGKSITTMAFALSLDRSKWIVTWIHAFTNLSWFCVRLIGDKRKTRLINISDMEEVLEVEDGRRHIVLIDGWEDDDDMNTLRSCCFRWLLDNPNEVKNRRLAFISSIGPNLSENTEIIVRAKEFKVWSWTLDEYLDATKDDEMFQSVSKYLDSHAVLPNEEMSRTSMVESKYYFAGGCCRYMFFFDTATVRERFLAAMRALDYDAITYQVSPSRIDTSRLLGVFKKPYGYGCVTPVISQYVAARIGIKCDPETIKRFMRTRQDSSNPVLEGWKLEMLFFASLRFGGLALVDAARNPIDTWKRSDVRMVAKDKIPELSFGQPVWIKPAEWVDGGYDAIMVCKETQLVRFVQVVRSHKRSFRIEHFYGWLKMLSESPERFEVKKVDIVFVVEQLKLDAFEISTVTGEGLLTPFGWPAGEEKNMIRRVAIRGLYDLSYW